MIMDHDEDPPDVEFCPECYAPDTQAHKRGCLRAECSWCWDHVKGCPSCDPDHGRDKEMDR